MARRSSARLRNRNSSTPQKEELSQDMASRITRSVPAKLAAVQEGDEMPGAFPRSVSPEFRLKLDKDSAGNKEVTTPKQNGNIKPSGPEMHPQQHHQSTAKPLDEARHLGFSNVASYTAPAKHASKIAVLQATPTRSAHVEDVSKSPSFHFTFRREHSLELSPDAKKLMNEKREEAARIREMMVADDQGLQSKNDMASRKIAVPKGKKKRFSKAHLEQFEKMESIANHASAFRADPNWQKSAPSTPQKVSTPNKVDPRITKSLKRSSSKAELDQVQLESARPTVESAGLNRGPAQPFSVKRQHSRSSEDSCPVSKRAKRATTDDVSTVDTNSSHSEQQRLPTTPDKNSLLSIRMQKSTISSAIRSSQKAKLGSAVKQHVHNTQIPAPVFTPSTKQVNPKQTSSPVIQKWETTLSGRSPTKVRTTTKIDFNLPSPGGDLLLARSPSKFGTSKKCADTQQNIDGSPVRASPLLARSPSKLASCKKSTTSGGHEHKKEAQRIPLLAQSPTKGGILHTRKHDLEDEKEQPVPLMSRSPSKFPMMDKDDSIHASENPGQGESTKFFGRFNHLRSSPIKSILRSPQRFYSNDPAKIAAGTHLATPTQQAPVKAQGGPVAGSVQKRVDFTSSTKECDEASSKEASSTPTEPQTPSPKVIPKSPTPTKQDTIEYPILPTDVAAPSPSPNNRRQTACPGDFTFRAEDHMIVFGQSPNAPASAANRKRPSTIRYVSTDNVAPPAPATGSKKRKFDFENSVPSGAALEEPGVTSDKENDNETSMDESEQRPAKRSKLNPTVPTPTKTVERRPTLGIKPKKSESPIKRSITTTSRPTTISQARLNSLAQPKKRA